MKPDPQHVHAEPGKDSDNVAEDRHIHQAPFADHSAPAGVQNNRVPDDNEQGPVFLRVPTPKSAPGLIGPDTAQHRTRKAEKGRETNDAINHFGEGLPDLNLAGQRSDSLVGARASSPKNTGPSRTHRKSWMSS